MNRNLPRIVIALAVTAAVGCRDEPPSGPSTSALEPVPPVHLEHLSPGWAVQSGASRDRGWVRAQAVLWARRGDSTALKSFERVPVPASLNAESTEGGDGEGEVVDAEILFASTSAFSDETNGYVTAFTYYKGTQASNDINIQVTSSGAVSHSNTVHDQGVGSDFWNLLYHWLTTPVSFTIGHPCGVGILGSTTHQAWWEWVPYPFTVRGRFVQTLSSDTWTTADCAPPPPDCGGDDGGGEMDEVAAMRPGLTDCDPGDGGSGGGYWVNVTTCWGYDVYYNGIYAYSVLEGCSTNSYFVAEE